LSFYLRLGFPVGFFHSGFHTKTLYEFLFFHVRVTCPTYPISLYSSFHVTDQFSHPCRITARTICNWVFSVIENDGPSLEIYWLLCEGRYRNSICCKLFVIKHWHHHIFQRIIGSHYVVTLSCIHSTRYEYIFSFLSFISRPASLLSAD